MNESSKSLRLPHRGPLYAKYCNGRGLDIGCGPDPLVLPGREIDTWDLPQGDAQYLGTIPAEAYDFVHSSHCFEHMQDAAVALGRWARVVKVGGFLMITVPSWTFYEQGMFPPSRFNSDHKQAFCVCPMPDDNPMGCFHSVGGMLRLCERHGLKMRELFLELDGYDHRLNYLPVRFDQTAQPFNACAQICYVLEKVAPTHETTYQAGQE